MPPEIAIHCITLHANTTSPISCLRICHHKRRFCCFNIVSSSHHPYLLCLECCEFWVETRFCFDCEAAKRALLRAHAEIHAAVTAPSTVANSPSSSVIRHDGLRSVVPSLSVGPSPQCPCSSLFIPAAIRVTQLCAGLEEVECMPTIMPSQSWMHYCYQGGTATILPVLTESMGGWVC